MEIEGAECELGYPTAQLKRVLGDRLPAFHYWFRGQTGAICDGTSYDYENRRSVPTNCGPHGPVVYGHDLRRFLRGLPAFD